MRFTKVFLAVVLVGLLSHLALGQKAEKPRFPPGTYKTTAKIFLKDEYRMYDSAAVILREAISFYPDDAELHFLLGKTYYHKNMAKEMGEHFAKAESLEIKSKYQEELQQMRQEKWLYSFNRGAKAFNEGNVDQALEEFLACTIINPQEYRGLMNAGYAYSLKGDNDKAISYLEEGLKLAPDSLDILTIYGASLYNAGKVEKALKTYLKIIEKNPTDVATLNNIVSIYGIMKDFDKALLYSQRLIEVDSTFKDAYFNIGTIYLQQIQDISLSLDSLKDSTGAYSTDQKCVTRREELEKSREELLIKAENALGKTADLDTSDLEARLLLARVYIDQEKADQAMEVLEFLIQRDSTNCEALTHLAGIYAKKEMAEEAKATWQKAQDCLESPLELQTWHWEKEGDFVIAEGVVKNTSEEKLENVAAVFSVYDANGEFITSDNALIEYDPLLPGQTSPFRVMVKYNPEIEKGKIGFKHLLGGSISFRKKQE